MRKVSSRNSKIRGEYNFRLEMPYRGSDKGIHSSLGPEVVNINFKTLVRCYNSVVFVARDLILS